jgi:hypothetical protein
MPTSIPLTTRIVTVCFAPGGPADWFTASELVDEHLDTHGTPQRRYRVRHRTFVGWFSRFFGHHLVDAARRFGSFMFAAGGRISRLDLTATVAEANTQAIARHRAFRHHIANTTPLARPWEFFLAQHHADPRKISRDEARRRFEAQQRVLAMLAHTGVHTFDPYELEAYQAGEATYASMHWKLALVGDALITTEGKLLQPAGPNLADRLRYLRDAAAYVRGLRHNHYLCAVAIN